MFSQCKAIMFKCFANKETQQLLTLEDWLKGISKIKDPLKLTDVLLSDWSFEHKVRILRLLPKKALANRAGMELLELQLKEFGHSQLAQVLRYILFWNLPRHCIKRGLMWSHFLIEMDIKVRQITQREMYLQEEIKALQKSLKLDEDGDKKGKAQLKEYYETELRSLNETYWDFCQFSGEAEGDMPDGILREAFKSCRSDPEWYLCLWLREDCAKRGGCCGRDCGCCEMAPSTTHRQRSRGHCTRACGCCIRTQERNGKDAWSTQSRKKDFSFDVASIQSPYSGRLNRAYIWHLSILDDLDL